MRQHRTVGELLVDCGWRECRAVVALDRGSKTEKVAGGRNTVEG